MSSSRGIVQHMVRVVRMVLYNSMTSVKDPLESIVGDDIRGRMLRLFVLNADTIYTAKQFTRAIRRNERLVREALRKLERDGIVKRKKIPQARRKSEGIREQVGYGFNKRYTHREFLEKIVRGSMPSEQDVLAKRITAVPGVECLVIADVFADKAPECVDVLIASSQNNEVVLQGIIRDAEKAIGRELCCAFLTVNNLVYRLQMNDKFVLDVLEGENHIYLDRPGILSRQ